MKLVATMGDCIQTAPDDFDSFQHVIELTPETEIQDLIDWQVKNKKCKTKENKTLPDFHPMTI